MLAGLPTVSDFGQFSPKLSEFLFLSGLVSDLKKKIKLIKLKKIDFL